MSNLKFLLFSLLALTFTACGNDDDAAPEPELTVVGDWNVIAIDYTGSVETDYGGDENIVNEFTGEAESSSHTISFSENPNTIETQGGFAFEYTSEDLPDEDRDVVLTMPLFIHNGSWIMSDSVITITPEFEDVMNVKLVSIEQNEMILEFNRSTVVEQENTVKNAELTGTYTCQRQ